MTDAIARPDRRALIGGIAALGLLPGCAVLSALGSAQGPSAAFDLALDRDMPAAGAPIGTELVIALPATSGALATDRILVRPAPIEAQYLPDARWTEAAPQVIQTLLVRGFEATGGWDHVGRASFAGPPDHLLVSDLVAFEVVLGADGAAGVRAALAAQLLAEGGARRLGARRFEAAAPIADLDPETVAAALNAAAGEVLAALAAWAIRTARGG
jgi:cholesterol transport system auxiliary component